MRTLGTIEGGDSRSPFKVWTAGVAGMIWLASLVATICGWKHIGPVECLLLLAPLVTIPLGLRLAEDLAGTGSSLFRRALILEPFGALAAVASFALPGGQWAGALAGIWWMVTILIATYGLAVMRQKGIPWLERACLSLGLIYLPFGGFWLFASRLGLTPQGFQEPIVLLTAVHFHYAAFAGPLLTAIAAIRLRAALGRRPRAFLLAGPAVMAAPALLAAGWALGSPILKIVAASLLAVGLTAVAALMFPAVGRVRNLVAGAFLAMAGMSVVAGMCLALVYAGGEFAGRHLISIQQMTVSHGILNGLGFALCGMLGWSVESFDGLAVPPQRAGQCEPGLIFAKQ